MKQSLKLMIDSSILIEALKGKINAKSILEFLVANKDSIVLFINPFVKNEVVFILIIYLSELSPRTLKKKKNKTKEIMKNEIKKKVLNFLDRFFIELSFNQEQSNITYELCEKYGLLPTDASILATCKHYGIKYLVSLDKDFEEPCKKESIVLIDSIEKLKKILNKNL